MEIQNLKNITLFGELLLIIHTYYLLFITPALLFTPRGKRARSLSWWTYQLVYGYTS